MERSFAGLVTQLSPEFYSFMAELQNKLAKVIRSVGKIEHAEYPLIPELIKQNLPDYAKLLKHEFLIWFQVERLVSSLVWLYNTNLL